MLLPPLLALTPVLLPPPTWRPRAASRTVMTFVACVACVRGAAAAAGGPPAPLGPRDGRLVGAPQVERLLRHRHPGLGSRQLASASQTSRRAPAAAAPFGSRRGRWGPPVPPPPASAAAASVAAAAAAPVAAAAAARGCRRCCSQLQVLQLLLLLLMMMMMMWGLLLRWLGACCSCRCEACVRGTDLPRPANRVAALACEGCGPGHRNPAVRADQGLGPCLETVRSSRACRLRLFILPSP